MEPRAIRWAQLLPDAPTVLAALDASSYAAEQYRSLAVQVEERAPSFANRGLVLAVSGCEPNCGKTLTSLNLALTLAGTGSRQVLLIETDLWRPHLSTYLRVQPEVPGLCQIIEEAIPFQDAVVPVWGAGLDVIFAGATEKVENLMADRHMSDLLGELRRLYDVVVLDSSPALLSSGRSVTRLADAVLVVVRAEHTKKKQIEDVLATAKADKFVGLVLNRVHRSKLRSSAYRAYSYYDTRSASLLARGRESGRAARTRKVRSKG